MPETIAEATVPAAELIRLADRRDALTADGMCVRNRGAAALSRETHHNEETAWSAAAGASGAVDGCPYHYLMDNLDAAVLFVAEDGVIRHANRYAAQVLDLDVAEVEGRRMRELLAEIVPAGPERDGTIDRLMATPEGSLTDEVDLLLPGGKEVCFSITRRSIRDGSGCPLGVVVVATDISEQRESEMRLSRTQQALRTLGAEQAMSEERKRRQIASRIHDEISQNLAYAKLRVGALSNCDGEKHRNGIVELNRLLDRAIEGSRALAFELSPPLLHELGFIAAVEWLVEQFSRRHGIEVEMTDDGAAKPLARDVSVTLFRAISELLTNVVEHAGARNVRITMLRACDRIRITVADDGHGFNRMEVLEEDGFGDGYGLFNISERLGYLGGTMHIESNSDTGTRVTLTAPLEGAA